MQDLSDLVKNFHDTDKNVMCENGPLFQYFHYFLHNKFLVNDESLQIRERWHELVETIAVDCDRMRRIIDFISCRKCV